MKMETNTNMSHSLTNTDTPPHKEVAPRVRPDPQDTCTVRIQVVERKVVELQPNSLGLQAILQDGVQVTRLITRTQSVLL